MVKRESRTAVVLIGVVVALAFSLRFAEPFIGRLELHQRYGNYGGASSTTGSKEYPRLIDDSEGYALRMSRPARTIASQYWSIDDYVYAIAPPSSVVAVSEYAFQHAYSNVFQWADLFQPAIATDPE